MKFLAAILILIAGIMVGQKYFNDTGNRISTEMQTAVAPSNKDAGQHFTAADLNKLGCKVDPGAGTFSEVNMPIIGQVKTYMLRSEIGCKVGVISQLSAISEGDEGMWAGVRAGAANNARKQGYDLETEQGNLGEHSEILIFSKNGSPKGFTYAVQNQGVLHSITVFSDEIQMDEKLESLIAEKL